MTLRKGRRKKSPYKHKNHLGLYVGLFIRDKRMTIRQAAKASNLTVTILQGTITGDYTIGIQTYFKLAEFMASKSLYDIGFFLRRLKEELDKGKLDESK